MFIVFGLIFAFSLAVNAEEDVFVPVKYKSCSEFNKIFWNTKLLNFYSESLFEVISVESTKCPLDDENRCVFTQDDTPKIRIGFKPGICVVL